MVHESIRNLRLDRRLLRRRGWLSPEELEQELTNLPDASEKAEVVATEPPGGESGASPAPGESGKP